MSVSNACFLIQRRMAQDVAKTDNSSLLVTKCYKISMKRKVVAVRTPASPTTGLLAEKRTGVGPGSKRLRVAFGFIANRQRTSVSGEVESHAMRLRWKDCGWRLKLKAS
jgi:hypothetical protein